jgi:hypothetical protein
MYKVIGVDQKEYGPVSAEQLRQWISEGRVNGQTRVQVAGSTDWRTVASLPEFAPLFPPAAPPLPPGIIHPPPPAQPRTNSMAVWALVTGIFSLICCQILSPVSIVLGAVALSHLKRHPEESGSGMALAGLILGILALLMAIIAGAVFVASPQWWHNLPGQWQSS